MHGRGRCVAAAQRLRDCARLADGASKWDLSSSKLANALQALQVQFWLQDHGLGEIFPTVMAEGHNSVKDLIGLSASELEKVAPTMALRAKLLSAIEEEKTIAQKSSKTFAASLFRVAILFLIMIGK